VLDIVARDKFSFSGKMEGIDKLKEN